MQRAVLAAILCLALCTPAAAARPSAASNPIPLKMKRGADTIVVRGMLRQGVDCCAYLFKARAGQALHWRETGANIRMVITYPDGAADGPGLTNPLPLPQSGSYKLEISPDLMADHAFGRFKLTLRIPPR